jgi:2-oxoisovalerate dehydrogenase E1 component
MERLKPALMGQDVAEYGGAFKITDGFVANLVKERNTPICESGRIHLLPTDYL